MSSPRRQTSSYQRIWSPGRASGVLVFFWTMIFWGTTQAVLSWSGAGQPLDLLKLDLRHFSEGEYWRLLSYQFLHAGPVHFSRTSSCSATPGARSSPSSGA